MTSWWFLLQYDLIIRRLPWIDSSISPLHICRYSGEAIKAASAGFHQADKILSFLTIMLSPRMEQWSSLPEAIWRLLVTLNISLIKTASTYIGKFEINNRPTPINLKGQYHHDQRRLSINRALNRCPDLKLTLSNRDYSLLPKLLTNDVV